jgi:hypothetical protein
MGIELAQRCERYQLAATIECGYCMPYENHRHLMSVET